MLTSQEIAALRALKGQTCVFREKSVICPVVVAEVSVDATAARFVLQPIPTSGFARRHPLPVDAFQIGGVVDFLHVTPFALSGSYISWQMVIDPHLVGRLIAFAQTAADDHDVMDEMHRVVFIAEQGLTFN